MKNKKGGSISSNRVNSLVNSQCPKQNNITSQKISDSFLTKNYGITYKTSGGSKKKQKKSKNKKSKQKKSKNKIQKKGGSRVIGGDKVPPTLLQKINSSFGGAPNSTIDYTQFGKITGAGVGLDIGSRGHVIHNDAPTSKINPLAGSWSEQIKVGGKIQPINKEILNKFSNNPLDNVGYLQAGGTKKKSKKGGGSDWKSTIYSRGAYNHPGQNIKQFSKFASPSNYISNAELSNGAASHFKPSELIYTSLLKPQTTPPLGTSSYGVSTKAFSGGAIKKNPYDQLDLIGPGVEDKSITHDEFIEEINRLISQLKENTTGSDQEVRSQQLENFKWWFTRRGDETALSIINRLIQDHNFH